MTMRRVVPIVTLAAALVAARTFTPHHPRH